MKGKIGDSLFLTGPPILLQEMSDSFIVKKLSLERKVMMGLYCF